MDQKQGPNGDAPNVEPILQQARFLLSQGRPTEALELVVNAVRMTRGDEAVLGVLSEAKESARREGRLSKDEFEKLTLSLEGISMETVPIISKLGKEQILRDAYADGSSFICSRCGALVAVKRKESHETLWCDAL